jgi:DNA-nicking Smr family endonuclease
MATGKAPERRRRPGLTEDDLALWRHATRADEQLPGRDEAAAEADQQPPEEPPRRRAAASARRSEAAAPPPLEPGRPAGLDKRSAQRLRRGQMPIEARLDLHGLTQLEAHRAVDAFLAAAQGSAKRCVLVITGKGGCGEPDGGVLRRMVPRWLAEPPNRSRVIAIERAQPRHGGDGALYVLLRKAR